MKLFSSIHIPWFMLACMIVFGSVARAQDEPLLPSGLEETAPLENEPALPMGLEDKIEPEEPALPEGLGLEQPEERRTADKHQKSFAQLPFEFSGFWEARLGVRTQQDPYEKDFSIGETRLQLQIEKSWEQTTFNLTTDFLYDPVLDRHGVHLEKGEGFIDLRELNLLLRPVDYVDIIFGRQTLTWGTGDLIFINDLFPKDWNSFFIGRDPEYLKAPSDAVKIALFSKSVNLDIVYTPRFDADRFIDGKRLSFFNNQPGRRTGRDMIVNTNKPDDWFEDDEVAWRFYKNINGYEIAGYGYRGFWKSPAGTEVSSGNSTFPVLSVYGVSVRGAIGKGISNIEVGYYNSEDDKNGDNPLVRNSELRFLAGYEQEAAKDFIIAAQYYLEHIIDYSNYQNTLPSGSPEADKNRHVLTLRLTKLLMNQDMTLSLFTFYSPSDSDAYLRPKIHYKIDDHWAFELGGNMFLGKDDHTFFGQFKKNNNLFIGIRYGF